MNAYLEATLIYLGRQVRLAGGHRAPARYIGAMPDLKPLSIAIYKRGPAWVDGRKLRDRETLLDHGRFLAALERSGQAVHAGPAHRLDEVPVTDPIGMASFPCAPAEASALLRDDPGLISGLLLCDVVPWHVADA